MTNETARKNTHSQLRNNNEDSSKTKAVILQVIPTDFANLQILATEKSYREALLIS